MSNKYQILANFLINDLPALERKYNIPEGVEATEPGLISALSLLCEQGTISHKQMCEIVEDYIKIRFEASGEAALARH
jgi:Asp-tRNA(Asn)/Glu-tRNA(Gln) amidotransferase B subunit